MKRSVRVILQAPIVLIGIGAVAFLLGEPHVEGRNAHATLFEIYFRDPFLAYAYAASIPFFIMLAQAFGAVRAIGRRGRGSHDVVKALRTIWQCAIVMIVLIALGGVFIAAGESDDHAGGIALGILLTALFAVIAAISSALGRRLQRGSV